MCVFQCIPKLAPKSTYSTYFYHPYVFTIGSMYMYATVEMDGPPYLTANERWRYWRSASGWLAYVGTGATVLGGSVVGAATGHGLKSSQVKSTDPACLPSGVLGNALGL